MNPTGTVLEFDDALALVLREAGTVRRPQNAESVPLLESLGRVLAEPVVADRDQPPFGRATRDGFAVRAADLARGPLTVVGTVHAGETWQGQPLAEGEAIEIMTGAPAPDGADAVVMVEHVEVVEGSLRLGAGRSLKAGENVVAQGSEARAGDVVVPRGTRVGAAEIALSAACGYGALRVYAKPRVAIVATGDELVEVDEIPEAHQIRNSNSYGIAALVTAAGGRAQRLAAAKDKREEIRERVRQGRTADLLILSGGVSMGKHDLVEGVLEEFGAEFFFTGVKMQPGRPVVFGRLPQRGQEQDCYFFGLPGNPVSVQVTFHCFAGRMLRALAGEPVEGPPFVQATLAKDVAGRAGLTRLLPARLESRREKAEVRLEEWHGSGDLAANARANCYAVLPDGKDLVAGEVISVLLR